MSKTVALLQVKDKRSYSIGSPLLQLQVIPPAPTTKLGLMIYLSSSEVESGLMLAAVFEPNKIVPVLQSGASAIYSYRSSIVSYHA